ncbi:unknown [Spodoptera litura nucleopolyhedrovirus II]|uniref:hypothetical protein n=1 Tax=Spodoptera litura nucleopolyhedrovirus II TaxID=566270 RepID=UPI00018745D1|nr:hypothetical protein SlnV2_gp034 [Spodoptera litura nucleopolyhedrovirus II]ACI47403.1 unknown [Spodoptera litura nucleopolyhedrovirus II]
MRNMQSRRLDSSWRRNRPPRYCSRDALCRSSTRILCRVRGRWRPERGCGRTRRPSCTCKSAPPPST